MDVERQSLLCSCTPYAPGAENDTQKDLIQFNNENVTLRLNYNSLIGVFFSAGIFKSLFSVFFKS